MFCYMWWGRSVNMICYWSCGGVGGVSVGTNTSIGIDMDIGGVLKNGFGILNFAEAPNLFRPRGVYIGGWGGW